jgi:hypothetical protein
VDFTHNIWYAGRSITSIPPVIVQRAGLYGSSRRNTTT